MSQGEGPATGTALPNVLRDPTSPAAWRDFVDRYAPLVYRWCRGRGLQNADAEDVTAEVLHKLSAGRKLAAFDPSKGSFGAWLRRVTCNALCDYVTGKVRAGFGAGDPDRQGQLHALA